MISIFRAKSKPLLYQVDNGGLSFGLEVQDGRVTKTAPISKWAIGRKFEEVQNYYELIKAHIKQL